MNHQNELKFVLMPIGFKKIKLDKSHFTILKHFSRRIKQYLVKSSNRHVG